MHFWLHWLARRNTSCKWITDRLPPPSSPLAPIEKRHHSHEFSTLGMPTPETTTVADETLPPPVLQDLTSSHRRRQKEKHAYNGLSGRWVHFKQRIGTGTAPSISSFLEESAAECVYVHRSDEKYDDLSEVDEVVVDRSWTGDSVSTEIRSEQGSDPEKAGIPLQFTNTREPEHHVHQRISTPLTIIRYRFWPAVLEIFSTRFVDEKAERHYTQESWLFKKSLAFWAALWLAINWILGLAFVPRNPEMVLMDKIFYYGVAPALSLPIVFMVFFDWPRDRPFTYQSFLIVSIWCWSFYQVMFMKICGYYSPVPNCQGRDFFSLFYYTTALQTIALFGLKLNRFPAAVGALAFYLFTSSVLIPLKKGWIRSMINFFFFHSFLIYVHYMREHSERRLFTLRDQLKAQFRATQKAQINERQASESKRRLTSYVRVPLNTALLAVQNMDASGTIAKEQDIEFKALSGSLSMMSKVLNDVLDFNRMDSGKFESAYRPYAFHQVMRSLFIPLQMAAQARGLQFQADLDINVDKIARQAAYEAIGESPENIKLHMKEYPDVDGIVMGDETRLRQIITNLASNACKFTPSGGQLAIKTRLVSPSCLPAFSDDTNEATRADSCGDDTRPCLSVKHLNQHNGDHKIPQPLDWIVVRIEVVDTGFGIKPHDMAEGKLFSAFNQTERGRQQGGKGTGLGLALVRQIVKLSGGRLGVKSKIGQGSTFWVELPLGIGRKTLESQIPGEVLEGDDSICHEIPGLRSRSTSTENPRESNGSSVLPHTNSAMHSLMEQAGRVELVLHDHTTNVLPVESPGELDTPQNAPESWDHHQDRPESGSYFGPKASSAPSATLEDINENRPTHLHLPTPCSFPPDTEPPLTSTSHHSNQSSGSSSTPLVAFDSNRTRSDPSSSSTAVFIEPSLPVLVVDDDPLTRVLMKRVLTRLGCRVAVAENGEVALGMILGQHTLRLTPSSETSGYSAPILEQQREGNPAAEEHRFAVIFLDNQMPVMSGLKVVEKLREMNRKDFVVGVTGNALLTDQQEYLGAGADRVLTKPVLERSLKEILVIADERRKASLVT